MKDLRWILVLVAATLSFASFANVVGVSTHPFTLKNKVITTEVTGNFSGGSGVGVQGRYFQRINQDLNVDAGFGISGGERSSRIFLGADYLLYPDHNKQPRISMKGTFEKLREFEASYTALGLTPTVSKGFVFWGNEAFPFVALPIKLGLDSDTSRYQTISSLAMGITGRLPINGYRHLIGNIEANLDIKNSYTGLYFGVSYPIK
ncbi:hypothetical protein N9B72_00560 [Bacteriovoracaceae bacterium]|jgi:hypothetical protein|nr:hypothetical protein [Bacteriovoracaceae bacterium]